MPSKKLNVKFIMTDLGAFLYDEITMNIYSYKFPHILVGKIEKNFTILLLKNQLL